MTTPELSVVIGVRNGARHIWDCLTRIYAQGLAPDAFEVIVADGRSEDGTRDLIQRFVDHHRVTNLRVIDNPRRTLAAAFNEAIPQLRGTFMAKVDAQSRLSDGYFTALMDALARHPEVAVAGGRFAPRGDGPVARAWASVFADPFLVGPAAYRYVDREQYMDTVYLGVYRTAVVRQVGAFDESLLRSEDTDFNHRIRQLGHRFLLVPSVHAEYAVRQTYRAAWAQFYGYAYYRFAFVHKHHLPLTVRQAGPLAVTALALLALACAPRSLPLVMAGAALYALFYGVRALKRTPGPLAFRLRAWLVYPVVHLAYVSGTLAYLVGRYGRSGRREAASGAAGST